MDDRPICLYTLGQKFCLDTPRTNSSLQRITENLLKFTREYGDILACQYPQGQTLKNHHASLINSLRGHMKAILNS